MYIHGEGLLASTITVHGLIIIIVHTFVHTFVPQCSIQ